jgi:hypothetical protein
VKLTVPSLAIAAELNIPATINAGTANLTNFILHPLFRDKPIHLGINSCSNTDIVVQTFSRTTADTGLTLKPGIALH